MGDPYYELTIMVHDINFIERMSVDILTNICETEAHVDMGGHVLSGAYEPPKEHETEFHDYPNYVTVFVIHHVKMALQPHEVEMSLSPPKKRKTSKKTQPTLPSPCFRPLQMRL